jgi:hypothetical protein
MRIRHFIRLMGDLVAYSITNRVTWLIPLLLILVVAALFIAAGNVAAPFVYTLF